MTSEAYERDRLVDEIDQLQKWRHFCLCAAACLGGQGYSCAANHRAIRTAARARA